MKLSPSRRSLAAARCRPGGPCSILVLCFVLAGICHGGTIQFQFREIRVPTAAKRWQPWLTTGFADVNGDRLADLLVVGARENQLWIYRQQASGFPSTPSQAFPLPARTAWISLRDIPASPGRPSLLLSTAAGWFYAPQQDGAFDTALRPLVAAEQVLTAGTPPVLALSSNVMTNAAIPVITTNEVVLYRPGSDRQFRPEPSVPLQRSSTEWSTLQQNWMSGAAPSHSLQVREIFRAQPESNKWKGETPAVSNLLASMKKGKDLWGMEHIDLDGDGREDALLWHCMGDLDVLTEVIVFLRGPDGQLPERPTQALRCRGWPVIVGASQGFSPVCDLDGDGRPELVLLAPRTTVTSWSSLVDVALSRGIDWSLTIRPMHKRAFAHAPQAGIGITSGMPQENGQWCPVWLHGDFNGDGRPDLLVRRSLREWNLVLSTPGKDWFARAPAFTFDVPADGFLETRDLNGDGIADLAVSAWDEPRIFVFLSQSQRTGRHP